ncbi:2-nitropropane dioxygenase [Embleya scabrispora]|uniref:2-nitropropane dioxygenase n=1 Tax=Embleya scabrispora TaxID=159449 RepID=A0A1T3NNV7_9ACTN|nr:2-nitropropane dioxygenase [Embleya scabrispora]
MSDPTADGLLAVLRQPRSMATIVRRLSDSVTGAVLGDAPVDGCEVVGTLSPLYPEWLGDRSFTTDHGVRFPYVAGEMAQGIAGVAMVEAMARADLLGIFGAAGLPIDAVRRAIEELRHKLPEHAPWGVNIIHNPHSPVWEDEVAALAIRHGVRCVSVSAFSKVTRALAHCCAAGLQVRPDGRIVRPRMMMAKVSRPEVAEQFLAPAPPELLHELLTRGLLTADEVALAARVPMVDDLTVESDSGGHTDGRPLSTALPQILALRDTVAHRHGIAPRTRIGAAGGLGTPHAVAAAFAMGAAYVVTGSVNQLSLEADTSDRARTMLQAADTMDVAMAPSADMFEMGSKVQVLSRGTMFAARASRLFQLYRDHESLEDIPPALIARLEREMFRQPVAQVWAQTEEFWRAREPAQADRAAVDGKHRMALVFRWYLGMSSTWATTGVADRSVDYQIWCGPAVGAFNDWRKDGFLADPANLSVVQIARNLMEGATVLTRAQQLRSHGVDLPAQAFTVHAHELL